MKITHWLIKIETEWRRPSRHPHGYWLKSGGELRPTFISYDDGADSGCATTTANEAVMFLAANIAPGDPCGWNCMDQAEYDRRVHDGDPDGGIKFIVKEFYDDACPRTLEHGTW